MVRPDNAGLQDLYSSGLFIASGCFLFMSDPTRTYLDFERPIAELDNKIEELERLGKTEGGVSTTEEVEKLRGKSAHLLKTTYEHLNAWQKTQVARHPARPQFKHFREALIEDFAELCGDRCFGDDRALIGGLGRFRGRAVMVIGHEKGHDTQTRLEHNFGMARPEGYRKAVRLMDMADRFGLPVLSFVDTAGAYPGVGAEERGQAEAIARSTQKCLSLGVPMVTLITGEGGSGGAVAIAAANAVLMMEHAIYSVISPEGCASILWRDSARSKDAATAMKITAQDLLDLNIIDDIATEPVGGAHRHHGAAINAAADQISVYLSRFEGLSADELRQQRKKRFLDIGRSLLEV
jgi:acetyl-CoA carboxylase carboxyl transferase subunit alpha